MDKIQTEICVIGAGVIGLAIAWRLAAAGRDVLVVERFPALGMGTSSRNSEVVHAGLYYPPDSLKTRLCIEGRREAYDFFERYKVPYSKCGKLLLASTHEEESEIAEFCERARNAGVEGLHWLSGSEVAAQEPGVSCISAWLSEESGIVSSHFFCETLARLGEDCGVTFAFRAIVKELTRKNDSWDVLVEQDHQTNSEARYRIEARQVINAAGLHADEVAALAGIDVDQADYTQHWVRGDYFSLGRKWRGRFSRLLYPVPEKYIRGLGVHMTFDLEGNPRLGPNVVEVPRVERYEVAEDSKIKFFESAARYMKDLHLEDLLPAYSGIRPKLTRPGEAARDFSIVEETARGLPGLINLLGIESPGLTASLAIAREVERLSVLTSQ